MTRRAPWWGAPILLLIACSEVSSDPAASSRRGVASATSAARPQPPPSGARCEHGLLRPVCTRCNPSLIPVFRAKGDWCAAHDHPESLCPICHPERGGAPVAEVTSDGAPSDGTKVRLATPDTARAAGIATERATAAPAEGGLPVLARITYDASRVAIVNARSPGVVRGLSADVGTRVAKGAVLASLESAAVGGDRSRLRAAAARARTAEAELERERALNAQGISSRRDYQLAEQELEAANAELAALKSALGVVGGGEAEASEYTLTAPIAGIVTKRGAAIGMTIDLEETIFEIVDASTMWAELEIPELMLARVGVDSRVELAVDALPGRTFEGRITYVAPEVDPRTRAALARVPLANKDGALRANMFARARVRVEEANAAVSVPAEAVQRARSVSLVFVRVKDDEFEARRVVVASTDGTRVTLLSGVRPGEEVVTTGSFLLKTETLKENLGAGCCEADARK